MPVSFFDTNVLVYLASGDSVRAGRAEQLVARGGTISVQVLNELANVCRCKMLLSWTETSSFLATIRSLLSVNPITATTHEDALALSERYEISFYDALIVAAALNARCETLWSEDMQDGMRIERRLRIVKPFAKRPRRGAAEP